MSISDPRRDVNRSAYVSALVSFATLIILGAIYLELRQRDEEIGHQLELAAIQTRGYEDYLTQSINNIDLALRNSLDGDALARGTARVGESFRLALRLAPHLRSISLLDGEGRIVASSNPANLGRRPPLGETLAATREQVDAPIIGTPWAGRDFENAYPVTHGQPAASDALTFLPIARQIVVGNQALVLLAAINTDYFLNHFSRQPQSGDRTIRIVHHDGTLLLSTDEREFPGSSMESLRFGDRDFQAGLLPTSPDHPVMVTYRTSRRYPLAVVMTVDRESALGAWRREVAMVALTIGSSLTLLCGLALAFYWHLMRTAQQQEFAERRLRLAATVFEASPHGIVVTDIAGDIVSVNPAFVATTGYRAEELIGQNPRIISSRYHPKAYYEAIWRSVETQGDWQGEIVNRRRTGEILPEWLSITRVLDENERVTHYVGVFSQITDPKADETRIRFLETHDFLTELSNLVEFEKILIDAMSHRRHTGGRLAILWIGLKSLSTVNLRVGYRAGDDILVKAACRLRSGLRETDAICRIDGAKFLVLLETIESTAEATAVGLRIADALSLPYPELPSDLIIEAHVGVATSAEAGIDAPALIRASKGAYLVAKRRNVRVA